MSLTAEQENFVVEKYNEDENQKLIADKRAAMWAEVEVVMKDKDYSKKRLEIKLRYKEEIEAIEG